MQSLQTYLKEATFKFEYGGLGKDSNNGGIKFLMR